MPNVPFKRHSAFTLIELLVVISIIMLVTGMTIPMVMQFFEKQKLPRAAKMLSTFVRSAQVVSLNYNTKTSCELIPGTDNTVRNWAFAGLMRHPSRSIGAEYDWDRANDGYIITTEARRIPRAGGTIRLVPVSKYSLEPLNSQGSVAMDLTMGTGLSSQEWEFSELTYSHYGLRVYREAPNAGTWWGFNPGTKTTGSFEGLKFVSGVTRSSSHKVPLESPVEIQVLKGEERKLPRGAAIDPVNYVCYVDDNGDHMPDGNPLAMKRDTSRIANYNVPLYIASKGDAPSLQSLYHDPTNEKKPRLIGGSLYFSKEGTLRKSLSLHYFSRNPLKPKNQPYFATAIDTLENIHYGFVVYDKANPGASRMMVEVTGTGQIRNPYGINPPKKKFWGENFRVNTSMKNQ